MISLNEIFDSYGRKARLFPAFLAASPLFALAAAYTPFLEFGSEHIVWAIVAAAAMYFLADAARRRGKTVENALVKSWGGYPSKIMLRHSDSTVDPHTKARYHRRAEALIEGISMPSPQEEDADVQEADCRYESVVRFLLANTRDTARFGLLLKENITYGFRRNLYGLKPAALTILFTCWAYIAYETRDRLIIGQLPDQPEMILLIVFTISIIMWFLLVTGKSVRDAADEYARQLLTSFEVL